MKLGEARLAWLIASVTIAVTAIGIVALLVVTDPPLSDIFFFIPAVVMPVVGALVASRRPENSIGWLCLAIGVLFTLLNVQDVAARWAVDRGNETLAGWIAAPAVWIPAVGLMATHLPLRLPTGAPASAGWRRFSWFCTASLAIAFVIGTAQVAGSGVDFTDLDNPLAEGWAESLAPLYLLLPVSIIGSIASLVVRYRRSAGRERLQLRWIALGACAAIALFILGGVLNFALFFASAFAMLPVGIGVAMLRHNLYDIDVVINRTLVYGALTATLAVIYIGSVLLLQLALGGVTEDSGLAVAASTLAVAALFRPARARIQDAVNRRFYRRRYDARRTLELFSGRLRDEVDLAALDLELRSAVAETMQPASVSLWLREPSGRAT